MVLKNADKFGCKKFVTAKVFKFIYINKKKTFIWTNIFIDFFIAYLHLSLNFAFLLALTSKWWMTHRQTLHEVILKSFIIGYLQREPETEFGFRCQLVQSLSGYGSQRYWRRCWWNWTVWRIKGRKKWVLIYLYFFHLWNCYNQLSENAL